MFVLQDAGKGIGSIVGATRLGCAKDTDESTRVTLPIYRATLVGVMVFYKIWTGRPYRATVTINPTRNKPNATYPAICSGVKIVNRGLSNP